MTHPFPETVEAWPIDRLIPYGRNARTHSDGQVAQIAASIVEFGWTNPVLADSQGNVIAGHGRLAAAKSLGLDTVPVVLLDHLTEAQRRAYILADNKLALNAGWDEETLAAELHALNGDGYDLGIIGFSDEELEALMAPLDDEDTGQGDGAGEDEAPEPPADPVTRPGDLWILGQHRLLCGDSTVVTDVDRLLGGAKPHLLVSDPPYGVEYAPEWRNEAGVSTTTRTGKVANDDRADWREAWALFPGEVAYVWHAGIHAGVVAESLRACDFEIRSQIIWSKPRFVLSRGHYHWQHEPCWYAVRKTATGHWQGARDQATVWAIGSGGDEDEATVHGTQKPVECMRRPMINNSAEGDGVYEPFAGSGTTVIAAETTGRVCFAMELNPAYADVTVGRWQKMTGQKAILDGDGRCFEEIAAGKAVSAG
ncbi:modification methylase DpnIIB [Paramagnetospirillum caucaseum]|uniref:Methyltransferase n=1 Tax=Paramagnetospirillum caucaseum TaxID=1244869 RepID=M3AAT0_9PROT|nr:DNA methyltransferase [Paramagnetospirillum caucaseum]EME69908.1 modification methylase DpnIIB [Paramagnetospirillum caucaseum]